MNTTSGLDADAWKVQVAPNPTQNIAWLQTEHIEGEVAVLIFDGVGRMLRSNEYQLASGEQLELDVANIAAGVLYIKVIYGQESKVLKLIKK